eukprot:5483124-Lingulodinium_polyedra.AAC.1
MASGRHASTSVLRLLGPPFTSRPLASCHVRYTARKATILNRAIPTQRFHGPITAWLTGGEKNKTP